MVIHLDNDLVAVLNDLARQRGVTPEDLANKALRDQFLVRSVPVEPQDDWERRLHGAAIDCGVSLSHEALSSEGL